jgi:hypothetical protein
MKGYNFITTLVKEKVFRNLHLRPFDLFIEEHFGDKQIVGAEIGVLAGCHAFSMLSHNPNIYKLYLIDPYLNHPTYEENYKADGGLNNYCADAKRKLSVFDGRTVFVKKLFQEATGSITLLDFCYYDIDGNYNRTKKFIDLYWSKIKPGGVIGGWNYDAGHRGVSDAVREFVDKNNLKLNGVGNAWWVVKEK